MAANLVSIRLDEKMLRSVERLARRKGVTRSEVVREAVAALLAKESAAAPETAQEVWARYIGCVRDGPPDLSERTGEKFRQLLIARARRRNRR